jgi:hypothetical protein
VVDEQVGLRLGAGLVGVPVEVGDVYPTCGPSQRGSRLTGGDRVRMCGFADRFRCAMQARLTTNVPRVLIDCIRS